MTSIRVITLGCSKNTVDTEHLLGALPPEEFDVHPESDGSYVDILLLNTCGFISDAKQESIEAILQAVEAKKAGLAGRVAVMGCLSQRYRRALPPEIPEVDAWFGARDLGEVVRWLGARMSDAPARRITIPGRGYAYLKISEGCDRRCSYCAIPFIRGSHRSVRMDVLMEEARSLAAGGVKELILIAQDTTYYGLDLYGRRMLGELLRSLSTIEGIEWLRIHYSYPADFPSDVLEQMATNPKVCKYLDIPLQHISDGVLSNMRRRVDGQWTRALIERLRSEVPGVVLRTTMIVGHPGEGEKEFGELLDFVKQARFERLGAFAYSEEEGTYGARHFRDEVPQKIKQERLDRLLELQQEISSEYCESRVGSVERVMVDDWVDGTLVCRSRSESPEVDGEILVKAPASARSLVGNFIDVRIVSASEYDMVAEML